MTWRLPLEVKDVLDSAGLASSPMDRSAFFVNCRILMSSERVDRPWAKMVSQCEMVDLSASAVPGNEEIQLDLH
jgi:hypothetical protein